MEKHEIKSLLIKHEITVDSEFIPWSKSRKAGEKQPSLNWKVTVKKAGRVVLSTNYTAGCGHAPSYKHALKRDWDNDQLVKAECETGFESRHMWSMNVISQNKNKPILPDSLDVIYSLLIDSEVLDYSSFEEWARGFGYDEDSRDAEKTYNACLKIALSFRSIGESVLAELRDAFQGY